MTARAKAKDLIDRLKEEDVHKFLIEYTPTDNLFRIIPRFVHVAHEDVNIYAYEIENKNQFDTELIFDDANKDVTYYSIISLSPDAYIYFSEGNIMLQLLHGERKTRILSKAAERENNSRMVLLPSVGTFDKDIVFIQYEVDEDGNLKDPELVSIQFNTKTYQVGERKKVKINEALTEELEIRVFELDKVIIYDSEVAIIYGKTERDYELIDTLGDKIEGIIGFDRYITHGKKKRGEEKGKKRNIIIKNRSGSFYQELEYTSFIDSSSFDVFVTHYSGHQYKIWKFNSKERKYEIIQLLDLGKDIFFISNDILKDRENIYLFNGFGFRKLEALGLGYEQETRVYPLHSSDTLKIKGTLDDHAKDYLSENLRGIIVKYL